MTAADNLISNYDKVHYTSYLESDKILGVYTGQVTVGTSSAFFTTYLKSPVTNSLTRKCYTQMRYSLDDGVTWQDGDSRYLTYSGGSLQYYLVVTSSSSASSVYIHVSNAGAASGAPQRTIKYEIVVFSQV